jgi:DNA-binding NarL/FixJ family response regulator
VIADLYDSFRTKATANRLIVPAFFVQIANLSNRIREKARRQGKGTAGVGTIHRLLADEGRMTMEVSTIAGTSARVPTGAHGEGRTATQLTPTQLKVMHGVRSGLLNKQIAHDLGIAEATVKAHMTALMRKLNVRNRTQVAIAAHAQGGLVF